MFLAYFLFSSTSFNFLFFPGIIQSLSCRNRLAQGLFLAWVSWGLSYDRNGRFLVGRTEKKGIIGIWISLCLSVWHQSWLKNKMKGINRRGKHVGFTTEKRDFSRRKRKKMGWGRIRMRWRIKTLERRIKPREYDKNKNTRQHSMELTRYSEFDPHWGFCIVSYEDEMPCYGAKIRKLVPLSIMTVMSSISTKYSKFVSLITEIVVFPFGFTSWCLNSDERQDLK